MDAAQETITYTRKKKTAGQRELALAHLPVERITYDLPEGDRVCDTCHGPLHAMSQEIRRELQVIPAQVKVIEHVQEVYACRQCERDALTTPIKTAPMPRPVYPGSWRPRPFGFYPPPKIYRTSASVSAGTGVGTPWRAVVPSDLSQLGYLCRAHVAQTRLSDVEAHLGSAGYRASG